MKPVRSDGSVYTISRIELRFDKQAPAGFSTQRVLDEVEVSLIRTPSGWVGPRAELPEGATSSSVKLSSLPGGEKRFYAGAIAAVNKQIVNYLNRNQVFGVQVYPDFNDIDPVTLKDKRARGRTALGIVVSIKGVKQKKAVEAEHRVVEAPATQTIEEKPAAAKESKVDGPFYEVSGIELRYDKVEPEGFSAEKVLSEVRVPLFRASQGWLGSGVELPADAVAESVDLADLPGSEKRFHAGAITAINKQIVAYFKRNRIVGVRVYPDFGDIDPVTLEDKRGWFRTTLRIVVSIREKKVELAESGRAAVPAEPVVAPVVTPVLAESSPGDGPVFRITGFDLRYSGYAPAEFSAEKVLSEVEVSLARTATGWVGPRVDLPAGAVVQSVGVAGLVAAENRFHAGAIAALNSRIVAYLNRNQIVGVRVYPDESDVDPGTLRDQRAVGRTSLGLVVSIGVVKEMRTVANGERVAEKEKVNNPVHEAIVAGSPVKSGEPLRKDRLEDYLFRLNRHPGRRVDVSLSSSSEQGGTVLDYLVSENKPWLAYAQVSNTGTPATNQWREHFGFIHNQLTGRDDILSVHYVTGGFDQVHALAGSYEAPVPGVDWLRWRAAATWSTFDASQVGIANQSFTGDEWTFGGEMIANVYQHRDFFVDVFGGIKWQHIEVSNELPLGASIEGSDDFFLPRIGVRAERVTDNSSVRASVDMEWNISDIAGTDAAEANNLGRLNPRLDWTVLHWDLSGSAFLEPILHSFAWWPDKTCNTLAHEVSASFSGQYVFDDGRLIPQHEQVVGGYYTVRGYPEATTAGDTVLVARLEYLFHLPRFLAVEETVGRDFLGKPFRFAPQQPYGRPDWDLVFRGFLDLGKTFNNSIQTFENDNALVGAGLGVEFVYRQNLSLRLDWGVALEEATVSGAKVTDGSNRFHFVLTVFY